MIVVAERLSEIALAETIEEHADSFGRSAFNRYYYASYLIIRDMLRQLDRSWTRTGHSEIPKLLAGEVIKRVRNELHRQEKARLRGSGKSKSIRRRQYAIRREDGRYVLTEGGLNMVPHGKGPQGSDVARALALGRKQW